LSQAQVAYTQILQIDPNHSDALHFLGLIAQQRGKAEIAIELMIKSIGADPSNPIYHGNLGSVLEKQGKLDEAVASYRTALSLKPDYADAHNNLGYVLQQQGKLDEAVASYNEALLLKSDFAEVYDNLGTLLQQQGKLDEAVVSYNKALLFKPDFARAYSNLGTVLLEQGKTDEALASYNKALFVHPDFAQAVSNMALAQLLQGDFAAGWHNYEQRWRSIGHNTPMRSYPQPHWRGEKLASGHLLIWGEQGVGDEIMFAALIPDVLRTGNRCILDCDARLMPLFARSFPDVGVVHSYDPGQTPDLEIEAHLPGGSLPGLFRTTNATFAATKSPYLIADPVKRELFRSRYDDGRRLVGLAWNTTNQKTGSKRSIDLSLFAPLFARSDIRWVSLQYGDYGALVKQVSAASAPILIDRSVDQLSDIDTFAAQVAAMDMVISIDNSTAHLAGALGVPVWVLLPFAADWRWLQAREDSPWYPTMRLFRQQERGNWQSVLKSIRSAL
jgi:Tfp pilus assembly protein PilF